MNKLSKGKVVVGKLIPKDLNVTVRTMTGIATDQTLTTEELVSNVIKLEGAASGGFNVIFNTAYKNFYFVINGTGQTATLKNAAGSTATLADGSVGVFQNDGTNIIAISGQSGTQVTLTGSQTMTNKVLTAPTITNVKGGVSFAEVSFTENGAGVYTGSVTIPAGATVLDVRFDNQALWNAATSATLDIGDGDDANGYVAGVNVKAAPIADVNGAGGISSFLSDTGTGVYKGLTKRYASEGTISAVITSVGAGTAGRSRMYVIYALPSSVTAATKV